MHAAELLAAGSDGQRAQWCRHRCAVAERMRLGPLRGPSCQGTALLTACLQSVLVGLHLVLATLAEQMLGLEKGLSLHLAAA